ncbi:hypothetical protein MUK70_11955 [Dyadobacter chenwenxiniae]|uniref:Uncharacterized protein n=1 Tax=Dyadobacter chenwenxiniae TaxID=2906456 RepID=A0A9X1PG43_9BACT|nr:hypothetical protein [Dyadobacter chenwenxiniae]MCF0059956.1 hypothetical protein [Dyadobacter chenwenxiniae]UON85695.1 hypothetical protein MUK70_11955 [Dyadobacter chenwenxiniae]
MEQDVIDFLLEKGVLKEGNTRFEISFPDGRTVCVNDLIEEFAEIAKSPANLRNKQPW